MADELDPLDALFARLVRALAASNPGAVVQPLEVAELSARWIPYPRVRLELGIASNEDYEVLLMRLLSGEGGYVFADESLQDDLKRELSSPSPDLTALRTYGAARITLAREPARRMLGLRAGELPSAATEPRAALRASPPASPVGDPLAPVPDARTAASAICQFCGGVLPVGRSVEFCPHCGLNVQTRRCPGCSSEVEPGWKFCVVCGRAVGSRN